MKTHIIGPSHFLETFAETQNCKHIYDKYIIDAKPGIPIFSKYTKDYIENTINKNENIVWIVPDYNFKNDYIEKIKSLKKTDSIYFEEIGHPSAHNKPINTRNCFNYGKSCYIDIR